MGRISRIVLELWFWMFAFWVNTCGRNTFSQIWNKWIMCFYRLFDFYYSKPLVGVNISFFSRFLKNITLNIFEYIWNFEYICLIFQYINKFCPFFHFCYLNILIFIYFVLCNFANMTTYTTFQSVFAPFSLRSCVPQVFLEFVLFF